MQDLMMWGVGAVVAVVTMAVAVVFMKSPRRRHEAEQSFREDVTAAHERAVKLEVETLNEAVQDLEEAREVVEVVAAVEDHDERSEALAEMLRRRR